ncbi:MAG: PIN domain-containing protein [Actinobacteria bacterium]|nr:PIN domain-containing protein [Actinomycetota bacterium]
MGRGPSPYPPGARRTAPLTAFLDTNVLIRHLTGDPPEMAARATAALAGSEPLLLTDLVLAECVYVLESYYAVKPDQIAELMRSALALPTINAIDPVLLLRALEVYEIERVDFAEAYLVAQAEATAINEILSFDRSIDKIETVTRREP